MATSDLPRAWRAALVLDALLSIGAAGVWLFDGAHLASSVFGANPADAAHVELARKGGLPFLFIGVQALWLALGDDLRALRVFHRLHLGLDLAMAALGALQLLAPPGADAWWAAAAQVTVSAARIALRFALLRRA